MLHRGKPPAPTPTDADGKLELTLSGLRDTYIESQQGKLEETTLAAIRLHFGHLVRLLDGERSHLHEAGRPSGVCRQAGR